MNQISQVSRKKLKPSKRRGFVTSNNNINLTYLIKVLYRFQIPVNSFKMWGFFKQGLLNNLEKENVPSLPQY